MRDKQTLDTNPPKPKYEKCGKEENGLELFDTGGRLSCKECGGK